MTTEIESTYALDLEAKRLSIQKPSQRVDKQGDMSDEQRLKIAMQNFVKDFGATAALYMEACLHCGHCAEACHFYVQTDDPKYTPIWKIEPFKRAYQLEASPFAFFYRTFNLSPKLDIKQLEEWQELIYDSCTMCGRCTMACPMGIDIATLVSQARHAMFKAGIVPHELWAVAERAEREGSPLGATAKVFEDRIGWMGDEHEVEMQVNKEQADVLVTMSSIEIQKYPQAIADMAKVFNYLGLAWTFHTEGYEATNFGLLSGNIDWQKDMSMKIINTAIKIGAKMVILPECGHAYSALRWQGANMYGRELPFKILHISEFLAQMVKENKLKLNKVEKSVAFHDPCQVSRRGGATQAPREVMQALGMEIRETKDHGDMSWCCGGGGGVITIHRADPLRYRAFQIKMEQMDATKADMIMTSCSNCRQSFDDGQEHFNWDKTMNSLLELVAANLQGDKA